MLLQLSGSSNTATFVRKNATKILIDHMIPNK